MTALPDALPIDPFLDEICLAVKHIPLVIVHASAGSGKTTRIPPALLKSLEGSVLVLEPRRIAARLAAERICHERGWRCGDLVGYQVRHEERSSRGTRLKFITEGLLLKYMTAHPTLEGVECVVLDEFHERHLHTDSALALLTWLQAHGRSNLRVVIMSATIDIERLLDKYPDARTFECKGRLHELSIEYQVSRDSTPLAVQVSQAVRECAGDYRSPGHILVFLPGIGEIRAAKTALESHGEALKAELLELRSELPFEEQARVFAPSATRKIILSTNIAETSVTIEGVTAVVDSGLARIAGFAHWSGLPTLDVRAVCRASCDQRAGRAGRTAAGIVKRLYSRIDYERRQAFELPEVARCDLTQMILDLRIIMQALTKTDSDEMCLSWLQAPPAPMIERSISLLRMLEALDDRGAVTSRGRRLATLPLHPRLASLIRSGEDLGCAPQALLCACIVSEGMIMRRGSTAPDRGESDVGWQRNLFIQLEKGRRPASHVMEAVDRGKLMAVKKLVTSLAPALGTNLEKTLAPLAEDSLEELLLAGFPDRVCQLRDGTRRSSKKELNFCMGGGGVLSPSSVVQDSPWLIALDAEEQAAGKSGALAVQVRVASSVSPELLALAGKGFVREEKTCIWDRESERVRAYERLYYGDLVLEEKSPAPDGERCEEVLFRALKERWPVPFQEKESLAVFNERCRVVREAGMPIDCPDFEGGAFEELLRHICRGKRSFSEIKSHSLEYWIDELLPHSSREVLEKYAPLRIQVGCNRRTEVHYEKGKEPWVASRLQDFFGTTGTPRIGNGRVPLIVHLLAPNGQAVQVTADLAGFWNRTYPAVRKELSRRYPRHYWPENPMEAEPRMPGKRK